MSRSRRRLLPPLLPIIGVDGHVLLPGSSMLVKVNDPRGLNLVENQFWKQDSWRGKYVGVVPKLKEESDEIHVRGTAASVKQVTARSYPQPHFTLLVTGLCRFSINELRQQVPYIVASITQLDYLHKKDDPIPAEIRTVVEEFRANAKELVDLLELQSPAAKRLKHILDSVPDQNLPDLFTSIVKASFQEKLEVLDAVELPDRFKAAHPLLLRQIETLRLLKQASNSSLSGLTSKKTPLSLGGRTASKWPLRPEEGEEEGEGEDEDELGELERKMEALNLPEHAKKAAKKELKRLKSLPVQFPEHAVSRNYLETLLELPWSHSTPDHLDLAQARQDLEADHYGLEKLKKRVLEYLAVRQLKNNLKGPILCFVGAPGVGKTSIGRSIAKTLGRKFHRISLGGSHDQSDIRGHRRTYIGSMPGRIIQGLKAVGANNPVFLLDEVDKLHKSFHGDPAGALLEVLDPEQNSTFTDHYLNLPFDLSQVLFIATANTTSTIPPPLLDRMEVIDIPGYTQEEKVQIALRHVIPKQLQQHGLTEKELSIPPNVVAQIVSNYTREAGVRNLEREIGAVCRFVAVKIAEGQHKKKGVGLPLTITSEVLTEVLGLRKFEHEAPERLTRPGVAVGLAWTAMGGEIMFVEATKMPGTGELVLTGQLGDVMKESAQIAVNWLRSSASAYGIACEPLDKTDIHIHFPAGAVGKDGPSAGITIVTVLASLFSGRCVRSDTALTGEATLRGLVLPVGGIKEKVLAAHRAGIKHIVMPQRNRKDMSELPSGVKGELNFTLVSSLEEVLLHAFEGGLKPSSKL